MNKSTLTHFGFRILTILFFFTITLVLPAQKSILPDFHADPSARVINGKLYVYPSHDAAGARNWKGMVDWPVFSTDDMVTWTNHGTIFSLKDISWADAEAWAPDCIERNGKYYFYFPAGGQIGVAVSDSPTGPFKDALGHPLVKKGEAGIRFMIDPNIFIDDDGQAYLYVGGAYQLGVVKLKDDMITRDGPIQMLELEKFYEGVWLHKRNGIYYASYPIRPKGREGLANVMAYSTAKSPLGPWEYKGEIIDNRSLNIHGSITNFKGRDYLIYHAQGPSQWERRVFVEPLSYNADGTIKPMQMSTPAHWKHAPTPPLGWNSWDIFGTTVTEQQAKEQADAMAKELLPSGYNIFTVDIQWYEPNSQKHRYKPGAELTMDAYGRLTPGLKKFPSAADGKGFKPLADYVHSKGLKFGIHIMRGIPRQAVEKNTPVLSTSARAADIALTNSICKWNPDMYGVDATKPAGQAYYDSIFKQYAEWGVDYVKVDDISRPYDGVQRAEIEAIRKAIDKTGRPIVLSLSPGATPTSAGEHVANHANLWRITDDFWDRWDLLLAMFERLDAWTPFRKLGAWPDADMIPLGLVDFERPTKFTKDEQYTLMTLWAIGRSPLIFGGDMTKLDAFTKQLLTNPDMLKVNQHSYNNRQVSRHENLIVWTADVPDSRDKYVALFNAQTKSAQESSDTRAVKVDFADIGLRGKAKVRDLWSGETLGVFDGSFSRELPFHGSGLYRISPQ